MSATDQRDRVEGGAAEDASAPSGNALSRALGGRPPAGPWRPPAGPWRPTVWRSPIRGPWLTSLLGTLLIPAISVMVLTGFISHWAYQPGLPGNATSNPAYDIPTLFVFPASWPSWDYTLTQGTHITLGLMTLPFVLAKLWSVIPRLFARPVVRNLAGAVERLSMVLLVGSVFVEFTTGIIETDYYSLPLRYDWYTVHYYGAWVFGTMFVLHAAIKMPTVRRAYRERGMLAPLRQNLAETRPEPLDETGLVAVSPAAPTISRRGLLAMVGGASLTILGVQVGSSLGGPFRKTALLAPRGGVTGTGPNDFPITGTAEMAHVTDEMTTPTWRLTIAGRQSVVLSRAQLLAMPQATRAVTINCTEGWSTTQTWSGVRLRDLARVADAPPGAILRAWSLESEEQYSPPSFAHDQFSDDRALLALRVNGVDLSLDHGYPARVIVPGIPGFHNTKWVRELRFETV